MGEYWQTYVRFISQFKLWIKFWVWRIYHDSPTPPHHEPWSSVKKLWSNIPVWPPGDHTGEESGRRRSKDTSLQEQPGNNRLTFYDGGARRKAGVQHVLHIPSGILLWVKRDFFFKKTKSPYLALEFTIETDWPWTQRDLPVSKCWIKGVYHHAQSTGES